MPVRTRMAGTLMPAISHEVRDEAYVAAPVVAAAAVW
jgi:hypothetical protein